MIARGDRRRAARERARALREGRLVAITSFVRLGNGRTRVVYRRVGQLGETTGEERTLLLRQEVDHPAVRAAPLYAWTPLDPPYEVALPPVAEATSP